LNSERYTDKSVTALYMSIT